LPEYTTPQGISQLYQQVFLLHASLCCCYMMTSLVTIVDILRTVLGLVVL
jgi:hypothetical protein